MPRCPRAVSRSILPALTIGAIWGVWLIVPTGPGLGRLADRAAAWWSPPAGNLRMGSGRPNRYRREEMALDEAVRGAEAAADFVGPPRPAGRGVTSRTRK